MNSSTRYTNAAVALVLLACAHSPASAQSGKFVATIQNLTTIRGAVRLTITPENDKQSRAKVAIQGAPFEKQIAWAIAEGRCFMNAEAIMPVAAFPTVTTRLDGSAEISARITRLTSGKQYYLRISDPQKEAVTDAAAYGCANISEES